MLSLCSFCKEKSFDNKIQKLENSRPYLKDNRGASAFFFLLLVILFLSTIQFVFSRAVSNEMLRVYRTANVVQTQFLLTGLMTCAGQVDNSSEAISHIEDLITKMKDSENYQNAGKFSASAKIDNHMNEVKSGTLTLGEWKIYGFEGAITVNDYTLKGVMGKDFKKAKLQVVGKNAVFGYSKPGNADDFNTAPNDLIIDGWDGSNRGEIYLKDDLRINLDDGVGGIYSKSQMATAISSAKDRYLIPGLAKDNAGTASLSWNPLHQNDPGAGNRITASDIHGAYESPDDVKKPQNCKAGNLTPTVSSQNDNVKKRIWYSGKKTSKTHLFGEKAMHPVKIKGGTGNVMKVFEEVDLKLKDGSCDCTSEIWCTADYGELKKTEKTEKYSAKITKPENWDPGVVQESYQDNHDGIKPYTSTDYKNIATALYDSNANFTVVGDGDNVSGGTGTGGADSVYSWGGLSFVKKDLHIFSNCTGKLIENAFFYVQNNVKIEHSSLETDPYQLTVICEGKLEKLDNKNLENTFLYLNKGIVAPMTNLDFKGNIIFGDGASATDGRNMLGGKITYKKPKGFSRSTMSPSNCGFYFKM